MSSASFPDDVDVDNPDQSQPQSNNNVRETSQTPDNWQIGVPCKDLNIQKPVLFSHGYFKKVELDNGGTRAKCMPCWVENGKEVLMKISDNSYKGIKIGHFYISF